MNVEQAMGVSMPSDANRVLTAEVKRLREHRLALYDMIPDLAGIPIAIWQEIHEQEEKEEDKEITVMQAISDVTDHNTATPQELVLVKKVNRLRMQYMEQNVIIGKLRTSLGGIREMATNARSTN